MPYRRTHHEERQPPDELTTGARWDDRILGLVMLVLAVPRIVLAVATDETFGAETTIAVIVACLGVLLLVTARSVKRGD